MVGVKRYQENDHFSHLFSWTSLKWTSWVY